MTYLLLLIGTYVLIGVNRRLLGIPGFFYYSSIRPLLRLIFREKLPKVEEVYYWEIAETTGNHVQLAILPAYFITFDLLPLEPWWMKLAVFLFVNYVWWVLSGANQVKKYIPQTPALRPRTIRAG